MSNNFSVKIYIEDIDELIDNWKKLENKCNTILFQSSSWFESWYENIFDKKQISLRVYCIYNNTNLEPEIIIPLIIKKKFNLKICEFFNQNLSDYNSVLIKKNTKLNLTDIWNNICQDLKKNCDLIHFERLPNKINLLSNDLKIFDNKIIKNRSYINFSIKKNIDFSKLQEKLPSNLIRKERKLNRIIDWNYQNMNNLINNVNLIDFFNLKVKQYKRTGARNIFNENTKNFYKYFFKNKSQIKPFMSAIVEKKTDKIIAGTFSFVYKNTFFWLFPVYDNNYKKCSPGLIYLKHLFDDLRNNYDINQFDFGAGDEGYKLLLSNEKIYLYDYYKYFSTKGLIFKLLYKLFYFVKNNQFSRPLLMKIYSMLR